MTAENAFFTICARNYLACATLLGESVRRHHPDASFTIWLLDPGELPSLVEGFDVRPIDHAVGADELEALSFYYDILELATAVKPRCFDAHLDEGARRVVYLDPDIVLFRPLASVQTALDDGARVVLTPHILAPFPRDRSKPDDLEILQAGIYNLGFLALAAGDDARELLGWWWHWLRTACFQDKARGTFTDQKWMNFTPLFWPRSHILRDTTYNVAYWNLAQRKLEIDGDDYRVDGEPLTFFHYSGYDPGMPGELSKHQTRIKVRSGTALARILDEYREALLARGHRELRSIPVPRVSFDNGLVLDRIVRHAWRDAVGQGLSFRNPQRVGIGSFFAWLSKPVFRDRSDGAAVPLTRYLMALYEMRADVRQVYPDVYGADRAGFLHWAREKAVPEMGADPGMLASQLPGSQADPTEARGPETAGPQSLRVNLVGYLRAALGIGEAARGYAAALQSANVDVSFVDCTQLCSSPEDTAVPAYEFVDPADASAPINVLHVNADQLPLFREAAGESFMDGRYNIGIWAWETTEFPEAWRDRFDLLDEIWTGSAFMADAVSRVSPLPVLALPHVVDVPDVRGDRAQFGLPEDEFLFLFAFDFHSTPTRKNPHGTVEAFRRAFGADDRVRLVLKSINGKNRPEQLGELQRAAEGLRVTVIDEALDGTDRFRLLRSCDAFVSLHRAEGFGLGLAEAMAYGMPVIATGWSGNMEFMDAANSFPVAYELEPLAKADPPYPAGTLWATPDLDHAAEQMRRVRSDSAQVRETCERARARIAERHSAQAIGERVRSRLEWIAARRGLPGAVRTVQAKSLAPIPTVTEPPTHSLTYRSMRACWRLALRVTGDCLGPPPAAQLRLQLVHRLQRRRRADRRVSLPPPLGSLRAVRVVACAHAALAGNPSAPRDGVPRRRIQRVVGHLHDQAARRARLGRGIDRGWLAALRSDPRRLTTR